MNESEWDESIACCDCGEPIFPDIDRAFACNDDAYLCFACAERRGGAFDDEIDQWLVPPDVADLADERRPHP